MEKLKILLIGSVLLLPSMTSRADTEDPCGPKLQVTDRISRGESRHHKAIETLVATNLVAHEAQANFSAGQSITLLPGFSAEQGATFTAQIETCSCNQNLASLVENGSSNLTLTAFPNPFVESTTIRYRLTEASPVSLTVFDEQGSLIEVLVNGTIQEAGSYEMKFASKSLQESVYLYSLQTKKGTVTKRLLKDQ